MPLILREELVCAVVLLFLLFYYACNKIKEKRQYFLNMVCLALLHVVFDIVTVVTVNYRDAVPEWINRPMHMLFYLTGILFVRECYSYAIHICGLHRYQRQMEILGWIPPVILTLLLLIYPMDYVQGTWTSYASGWLANTGYIVFLLYGLLIFALLLIFRKKLDTRVRWALFPMLGVTAIIVVLQIRYPEMLMTSGIMTFICLGVFVALDNPDKMYREQALWDFLTGLRNRNSYNRDLEMYKNRYAGGRSHRRIGFIVADLNNLKTVNDTYGHTEGDRLITAAADALRENLKSAEQIYRIGGDEFTAIYLSPDEETVAAEIEQVRAACEQATGQTVALRIAIGYCSDLADENILEIFERADHLMYENKVRMKKDTSEPVS
ncbi:MAG: GGDEF domain-containing protein [Oscillospiraceae bacterium]|nr:GGDEF domain-containing protein [Oscillospiraceae bacterium]